MMIQKTSLSFALSALFTICVQSSAETVKERLAATPYHLVYEKYADNNWELFVSKADGTGERNLTNTPDQHELYPQVSPDGTRLCFVSDKGSGRNTVRSVYVMNIDGSNRKWVADEARQPCWTNNSNTILYLPQEYSKWNVVDYFTKGLVYYNVETGVKRSHPNSDKLHHLYNPSMSPDGKWIGYGQGGAIKIVDAAASAPPRILVPEGPRSAHPPGETKSILGLRYAARRDSAN